jgi:hypothetical protein
MKADHLRSFNFLALPEFGKYKKKSKLFLILFFLILELWMYHTPLTWYEQENLGQKAHFEAFHRTLWFLASTVFERWITQTLHVGLTGRYTRSQNP